MSIKNLSITKVKLAFECPRLLYLAHYVGGKTMFHPPGNNQITGVGTNFHTLADRCIEYALTQPDLLEVLTRSEKPINEEKINLAIGDKIYQNVFFPYLQKTRQDFPAKVRNLQYLWFGLTELIRHWTQLLIGNMEYCPVEKVIKRTFIAQEYKLSHTFSLPDGGEQLIKGKLDSLVFDFQQHRLCVVEYKTYHPVDPTAQFAQVALYSYILHRSLSIQVDARVFCVLPRCKQYVYSWQELEKSIYGLIPHKLQQIQQWLAWQPGQSSPPPATSQTHLCDRCPQRKKCRSFFD